ELVGGPKPSVGAFDDGGEDVRVARALDHVIGRTSLEEPDGSIHVAGAGDEDDGEPEASRLHCLEQLEPGAVGQAVVGEEEVDVAAGETVEGLLDRSDDGERDVRGRRPRCGRVSSWSLRSSST